jgi:hypothetical protein
MCMAYGFDYIPLSTAAMVLAFDAKNLVYDYIPFETLIVSALRLWFEMARNGSAQIRIHQIGTEMRDRWPNCDDNSSPLSWR